MGWSDQKTTKFFQPGTESLKFPAQQPGTGNQYFVGYRWKNNEKQGQVSLWFGFLLIIAETNRNTLNRKLLKFFKPEQTQQSACFFQCNNLVLKTKISLDILGKIIKTTLG